MRRSTNNFLFIALMLISFSFVGCSGEMPPDSDVASRLQVQNVPLSFNTSGASASSITVPLPNLQLIATLTPPVVNGVTLQADDVVTNVLDTYVTYNVAGSGTGGGVDVVDVSVPTVPVLGSSTTYADTDMNGLYIWGNTLYVAAQNTTQPAILNQYSLGLLGSVTGLTTTAALPSYAGVQVTGDLAGNYLYVISGDNSDNSGGGLQILNRTSLTPISSGTPSTTINDARDVALDSSGNAYVLTGGTGNPSGAVLKKFNATGAALGSLTLGGGTIAQSKSTVQIGSHYAIATTGETGTQIVCIDNMSLVATQAPPTPSSGVGVTNSAILTQGLLVTANGDQGVNVYSVATGSAINGTSCNNLTISFLGSINFGMSVSANSLKYTTGLLFVGAGAGGYQILTITVPVITAGLLTTL